MLGAAGWRDCASIRTRTGPGPKPARHPVEAGSVASSGLFSTYFAILVDPIIETRSSAAAFTHLELRSRSCDPPDLARAAWEVAVGAGIPVHAAMAND
jgi:hypothetical protein